MKIVKGYKSLKDDTIRSAHLNEKWYITRLIVKSMAKMTPGIQVKVVNS